MPPEPIVTDPMPDPPAFDNRLGFDSEASSQEEDASTEDEER